MVVSQIIHHFFDFRAASIVAALFCCIRFPDTDRSIYFILYHLFDTIIGTVNVQMVTHSFFQRNIQMLGSLFANFARSLVEQNQQLPLQLINFMCQMWLFVVALPTRFDATFSTQKAVV